MTEPAKSSSRFRVILRNWWSLPVFAALLAWEFYSATRYGKSPDWIWVGIAVAGLIGVLLVNMSSARRP